ncbi:hypothetical protein BFP72_09135 [Reichenbachiella sp. 5M10]|uniref:LVIVD repeat-containing protein n=1 Tax=Reichenbachiella sp. 5M10 TaxID=1889772 RepID=UPI000C153989|nr:hypothetical protein [Reichenbachiella sp. 5M10]PIB35542.1 hypothetical protein BFP72_09135 [Reichenbachiella sp. 5M10]
MKNQLKNIVSILLLGILISCNEGDADFSFDQQAVSTSGSIAKFYIDQTHLYVIEKSSLSVFDVTDFENVKREVKLDVDREVETIYRLGDVLYLGTTTAVLFYDVSNPIDPKYLSSYEHFTGCDPVVSDGKYAYTTLRTSAGCGGGNDVLDVVDLTDVMAPTLVQSVNVSSPYGLVLFDDYLFVGQGNNGMRVFNVADVNSIQSIGAYGDIKAIDFIRDEDNLIITTETGLVQVKVQTDGSFIILSQINY